MFAILKNVAVPEIGSGRPLGSSKYPFSQMTVSDGFVCKAKRNSVANAANQFVKRHQPTWKFTTRKLDNGDTGCWRVK